MPQSLGAFIRERRQTLGLSQEQLAARIGQKMRQADVSRLESNRIVMPRRDRLEAIAAAIEVSLGELLLRTGWMQDGDVLATAIDASPRSGWTAEEVEALSPENARTLLEAVNAVETMVAAAAASLEQTQQGLVQLRQMLARLQNPRSDVQTRVGVMDHWETSAPFVA